MFSFISEFGLDIALIQLEPKRSVAPLGLRRRYWNLGVACIFYKVSPLNH